MLFPKYSQMHALQLMDEKRNPPSRTGDFFLVRMPRLELGTSRLSGVRSNQLSYTRAPQLLFAVPFGQAGNKITGVTCPVNGAEKQNAGDHRP